ncbi:MAG: molybdopterin-dependent oxidoreductase [Deltaproteobacteria bacterium]|nr:molybdopterin-dependent oxidoreductase [Deltaproteobacteria bacterium]
MSSSECIGKRLIKKDGLEKVTGRAIYGQDLVLPRMLYGKILYSMYPYARILSIDTSKAKRVPGVRVILTGYDIPEIRLGFLRDNYPLKKDVVRWTGDEIAAVAAESEEAAEEAIDLIEVEYEELDPVFTPEDALRPDAPILHEGRESNRIDEIIRTYVKGDVEEGFAESDVVLEETYELQHIQHCTMGTYNCTAAFDAFGRLTIWSPTQVPFIMQRDMAQILGMSGKDIRIVQPVIGGAFGKALDVYPFEVITVLLAKKARRPVKIVFTREEEFTVACKRQAAKITLKQGVTKDGLLKARKVDIIMNAGAYVSWGPLSSWTMVQTFGSFYKVPHISFRCVPVYTNMPICGSMRGYGNPQAHFALESQMDMLAEAIGMDPVEFRKKNSNTPNETTHQGIAITSCGYIECLEAASKDIGWKEKRGKKTQSGPNKVRGIGLAGMWHVGGGSRIYRSDGCGAIVKIDDFGNVILITGASEIGQGSDTSLCQIVAEVLGVPYEKVTLVNNDTDITPWDVGCHASRTTFICGKAALQAAQDVRSQLLKAAAEIFGTSVDELETKDGIIYPKDSPEKGMPYDKVVRKIHFRSGGDLIIGKGFYDPPTTLLSPKDSRGNVSAAYTFASQAVEVEVDTRTGRVEILRAAVAHDIGKVINPVGLEGQIEGGVVMAMGYGLYEETQIEEGRVINPNYADYHLPTSLDAPPINIKMVETNDPEGPFGAKGVGECAAIAFAPAIANAIYDAVGVRIYSLPITPEKVYRALQQKENQGQKKD